MIIDNFADWTIIKMIFNQQENHDRTGNAGQNGTSA